MEQICPLFIDKWIYKAFCKNMGLNFSAASFLKENYSSVLNQSQKYYDHVAIQNNHIPF